MLRNLKVGSYYEFTDKDGTEYEGTLTEIGKDYFVFDIWDNSDVEKNMDEIAKIKLIEVSKEEK